MEAGPDYFRWRREGEKGSDNRNPLMKGLQERRAKRKLRINATHQ